MIGMEHSKMSERLGATRITKASSVKRLALPGSLLFAAAIFGSSLTHAQVGDPDIVSYPGTSIGILGSNGLPVADQINHDPRDCTSQALAVDLGAEVASAEAAFTNLKPAESLGEYGLWEAFDAGGSPVGSEEFTDTTGTDGSGSVTIMPGAPFQYLVFTGLPYGGLASACSPNPSAGDSTDYFISSITFPATGGTSYPQTCDPGTDGAGCAWAGLSPSGFDFGVAYTEGGRFVDAPIVVNTETCEGGTGNDNQNCVIPLADNIVLNIQNAPDVSGELSVNGVTVQLDPRPECGGDGSEPGATILADGSLQLDNFPLNEAATEFATISRFHCGIPDPDSGGAPTIKILDVDSDLVVISSALELIDNEPKPAGFECREGDFIAGLPAADASDARVKLPVIAYLPKTVNNEDGTLVATTEAATFNQNGLNPVFAATEYACGSGRSNRRRMSYTAYNLARNPVPGLPEADQILAREQNFDLEIREASTQLAFDIGQGGECINRFRQLEVSSLARRAARAYNFGALRTAKYRYIRLLNKVSGARFTQAYEPCLIELNSGNIFVGTDPQNPPPGSVPRNFRGDYITQISHILYMLDRLQGQLNPDLPSQFDPTTP